MTASVDVVVEVAKNKGICHTGASDEVFSSSVSDPSAKNQV